MKKLGRFPGVVGYQYVDQLAEQNIFLKVIDTSNTFSHYANHGTTYVELWAQPEDYDKALALIQALEREAQSRVDHSHQQISDSFWRVFFILLFLFFFGFLIWRFATGVFDN